jgi:preprotein translocase subunit SecG
MELIFLIIQLIIAAALIGIVLMQRSGSDGFGLGSGSGSNFLSGRQTSNLMTRATAILAAAFMINSLWLGILASSHSSVTLVDEIEATSKPIDEKTGAPVDAADKEAAPPAVPAAGEAPAVPAAQEPAEEKPAPTQEAAPESAAPEAEAAPAEEGESEAPKAGEATPSVPSAD